MSKGPEEVAFELYQLLVKVGYMSHSLEGFERCALAVRKASHPPEQAAAKTTPYAGM